MRKRVLIAVPCLLIGGTEVQTLWLAKALLSGGYRVIVCADYEFDPGMVATFQRAGVEVCLLNLVRRAGGKNLRHMPRLALALASVIRKIRPDIMHVQYMAPGVIPILLARLLRIPHVLATVHVSWQSKGGGFCGPRSIAARFCDVLLCVSQDAERSFFGTSALFDRALYSEGRRHFTICNCVDLEDVAGEDTSASALRKSLNLDARPVVGMVSRLSSEKGPQHLLDAMPEVLRSCPDARALMVGGGPDQTSLLRQATQLRIAEQIVWTGALPPDEARAHLAVMDVLVMPSKSEGFGLAAAEAMACGKPVVAFDVLGLREVVVHGETGLLTPFADSGKLASVIVDLLLDGKMRERMGKAGRRRVEEHFSSDVFTHRHLALYASLPSE